jgi:uncharacterized protein YcbX
VAKLTVKEIWRYPVKSMRGEMLAQASVGPGGIVGDRIWVVRGPGGALIPDRKNALAALLDCTARLDALTGAVEITLPDGRAMMLTDTTKDAVRDALAKVVAPQEITLWRTGALRPESAPSDVDPEKLDTAIRRIFAFSPRDTTFPDFSHYPAQALQSTMHSLTRYMQRHEASDILGVDFFPVNVLTEASLRHLEATITHAPIDRRRFRPNLLIADDEGLAEPLERAWEGHEVVAGDVRLFSVLRCVRCVMPSLGQAGAGAAIPRDPVFNPAHTREMAVVGMYASVLGEGCVAIGDPVRALRRTP